MAKTIRRNPLSVNTVSLDEKYTNFMEYKGLCTNKNFVTVDQETFSEVNNMYVNQDKELSTRPPTKIFVINGGLKIVKVWKVNDKVFYHVKDSNNKYKFAYPKPNSEEFGFIDLDDKYSEPDSIYFCWFNFGYALFMQDKIVSLVYLKDKVETFENNDAVYFPITKIYSGQKIYTSDSQDTTENIKIQSENVLTNGYRERYLFDPDSPVLTNTTNLEGKTVSITIDGSTTTITWQKYNDKVFFKKIGTYNWLEEAKYDVKVDDNGNTLFLICDISTCDFSNNVMTYYVSLDANNWYSFTGPASFLVISDDLKYIYRAEVTTHHTDGKLYGTVYYKIINILDLSVVSNSEWQESKFDVYANTNLCTIENNALKLTYNNVTTTYQFNLDFSTGYSNKGSTFMLLSGVSSVSANDNNWTNNFPTYIIIIGNLTDGFKGSIFFTKKITKLADFTADTTVTPSRNMYNIIKGVFYETKYLISLALIQTECNSITLKGLSTIYNYKIYATSNGIVRSFYNIENVDGVDRITLNPEINNGTPERLQAYGLAYDFKDYKKHYICYTRYDKSINDNTIIDTYSLSNNSSQYAEYTIRKSIVNNWSDISYNVEYTTSTVTIPVRDFYYFEGNTNAYRSISCKISNVGELLTTGGLYYSGKVIDLIQKNFDEIIYLNNDTTFRWYAIKNLGTPVTFYSNLYTEIITVDYLVNGKINYIVPEHSLDFLTTCLSENNLFYQSSKELIDVNISLGKNLFYIPKVKNNENVFTDKITQLVTFSQTTLGIFLETTAYQFTYDSSNDNYYLSKTKLSLGNRDGSDMLLSYDGSNIYITTLKGLSTLNYQDFVQSTEQIYTYLTESIIELYKDFSKYPIKLCQYKDYLLLYHTNDTEVLMFDLRNASWWKWTLSFIPKQIIYINDKTVNILDELVVLKDNGELYKFDFDNNSVYDNEANPFDWSFTTQKLHFGAPNNYKHIRSISIVTEQNVNSCRFKLKFINYRNLNNLSDTDTVEYEIDQFATMIKKVNFIKTNAFQFQVSNDVTDKKPKSFVTSNISIKYIITERLR